MLKPISFTKSSLQLIISLLVLTVVTPNLSEAATLSPTPTNDPVTNQLTGLAQAKLDAEYNVLITGDSTKLTKPNFAMSGIVAQGINDDTTVLLRRNKGLADHGQHYTKALSELTVQKLDISKGTATMTADEYVVLHLDNGTNDPVDTKEWHMHIFHFTLQGNQWTLTQDENPNSSFPIPSIPDALKITSKPLLFTGKSTVPISRNGLTDTSASAMAMTAATVIHGTYNPTSAVNYAKTYAYHNNTAYITYQNDCTSFVSQALNWGGWQHIGGWYTDDNNWWYSPNRILAWGDKTQANSWIVTNDFYWFARNSGRATNANYFSDLRLGDVIQMNYTKVNGVLNGILDHTMIVTKIDSNGAIYVTEHSDPHIDKSLWDINNQYPGAAYYGTVMRYQY